MPVGINLGLVGATGMVGEVFLQLLEERQFPIKSLKLFASEKSLGLTRDFRGQNLPIETLAPNCFAGLDMVFFSSGDEISQKWAPQALAAKAFAIDNSAAFRLDANVPLVVPEINGHELAHLKHASIISNPNCSTIQLVMLLKPLLDHFDIDSVHVASYQSVSGAGKEAQTELVSQTQKQLQGQALPEPRLFAKTIAFNCVPQIGSFGDDQLSSEERKIQRETKKILARPELKVSAWTVRIAALNAHSEAVWVRLKTSASLNEILACLNKFEGLSIADETSPSGYLTAREVSGQDPVFVGRVHQDIDDPMTWKFWIVADNLRKGAALNGIQIAEKLAAFL